MTGPLRDSDNRPFVKTRLKYDVTIEVPEEIEKSPPKAEDVLDKRVNAVQEDVIQNVKSQIGDVILAAQNFSHPNRTTIIDTQREEYTRSNLVKKDHVNITLTYAVEGTGIGESAETRASLDSLVDMHRVLLRGDNTPIEDNTQIREFDSGPLTVISAYVTTE